MSGQDSFRDWFQDAKPYLLVVLGFFAFLLAVLLIMDNLIMPAIVHCDEKVKVPAVTGEVLNVAERRLENSDLKSRVSREIYSEKYKAGCVVNQIPVANSLVKQGRPIFLIVSKGKETVPVPYLIGSNLRNARVQLLQRGLELGEIEYEFNELYSKDIVSTQSRSSGTYVPYGSSINVLISKGSELQNRIPMLVGFSFDEIAAVLKETGFILGNINYKVSETYLPNTIISQSPQSDQTAPPGTPIDIIISK